MRVKCCICQEVVRVDGDPDTVSHGMHKQCVRDYYGVDFDDILEGEPT